MSKFYNRVSEQNNINNSENVCNKLLKHHLPILFITILYIPIFIILIIIFLPIYILRFIILLFSKILRQDLDQLVNTRSVVLAVDGFPNKPCWNIVVWLTQEGILDLDKFRKKFLSSHIQKRDHTNGSLIYPEYQQYLHKWFGFYFWRWDQFFDIKNHIRLYDGKYSNKTIVNDDDIVQIMKELTWKPWNSKRSPWEFLQIQNYCSSNKNKNGDDDDDDERESESESQQKKSILIFRIHHVMGDGYYVLKLLMGDLAGFNLDAIPKPNYIKRNIFKKILFIICFWIRAPYHLCKMYIEGYDINPWHISHTKFKRPMNTALTKPISLEFIKEIKRIHKVNFTTVIHSAVAGGIRNMMIEQGIKYPKDIHMGLPVPMPGHPKKLRNHFICSVIALPVGTDDPLQRLKRSEIIFQEWKKSSAAMLNFIKVPLVGSLLPCMMHPFTFNRLTTCLMSNFPGTPYFPVFQGVKVVDIMFAAGFGPGNNGIGFTLISCAGYIRLLSAVDSNILETDLLVDKLNAKIIHELEILHELGNDVDEC